MNENRVRNEEQLLNQIKERREDLGFSQRGLCAIIDMKQPSLVKIEKGLISPRLNTLLKILEPLGFTIEFVEIEKKTLEKK